MKSSGNVTRRLLPILLGVVVADWSAAQLPPGDWSLRWADEFNETGLDPDKWNVAYPWTRHHNYPAYIKDENISVEGGVLKLQAKREPGWYEGEYLPFTSGAVNTNGLLDFHLGYIESRMKLPAFLGAWPAFWMLQDGWPPELDIMEARYRSDFDADYDLGYGDMCSYIGTYHWGPSYDQKSAAGTGFVYAGANLTDGFHTYGALWESDQVSFYFDGRQMGTVWASQANIAQMQEMYLLLNLGVGGWPGDPPAWADLSPPMQVDWVRVWQHPGAERSDWIRTGDGYHQWDDAENWNAGVPQLNSQTAYLGNSNASSQQIDWNGTKTLANLVFETHVNFQVAWPDDQLMMASASGVSAIEVRHDATHSTQGVQVVGPRLQLANDLIVRNANPHALTFLGSVYGPGRLQVESGKVEFRGLITNGGGMILSGNSEVTLTAGMNTPGQSLRIGSGAASNSLARVGLGSSVGVGSLVVGDAGGTGTLVHTAGSVNVTTGELWVGQGANGTGSYLMQGGELAVNNWLAVGRSGGNGVFRMSSGTLTKQGSGQLIVGSLGGRGAFEQTGGVVDVRTGDTLLGEDSIAEATYTITSGVAKLRNLILSQRGSGSGTFHLNGGRCG